MNISLQDLQNFVKTSNSKTISEAALLIGITQPALSESIKRLETALGQRLFYRTRQGISLTPAGKEIKSKSQSVLNLIGEMGPGRAFQQDSQKVTLGCHELVGSYSLPKALKSFASKWPSFQLSLQHGLSRTILESVQLGKIDVGLVVNPSPSPDVVISQVATDEICVWSYRAGLKPEKTLCNPDMIQTAHILSKWKKHPTDMIYSHNLELLGRLCAQGVGYAILPERSVKLLGFDLTKHEDFPRFKDKICLVYKSEFGKNPFQKDLLQCLKASLVS